MPDEHNTRDGDAERIQAARDWIAAYTKHIGDDPDKGGNDWCAWVCVLLRSLDAGDAALSEARREIEDGAQSIRQEREEVERLNGEIDRLLQAPAARAVEAAQKLRFGAYRAHGSRFVWTLVEGDPGKLSTALADYDAALVAEEV